MAELGARRPGRRAATAGSREDEAVSDAAVIMFGGIETTEGMILNLLWHVLDDRRRAAAVAADPALAPSCRRGVAAPRAGGGGRRPLRDARRRRSPAQSIRAGDLVVVSLAGANRDPAEFPDPDRFDLHRPNARRHLAFAAGPHVCIGMDLARLEAVVAVHDAARPATRRPPARRRAAAGRPGVPQAGAPAGDFAVDLCYSPVVFLNHRERR